MATAAVRLSLARFAAQSRHGPELVRLKGHRGYLPSLFNTISVEVPCASTLPS
jgi:hypothetical protein